MSTVGTLFVVFWLICSIVTFVSFRVKLKNDRPENMKVLCFVTELILSSLGPVSLFGYLTAKKMFG